MTARGTRPKFSLLRIATVAMAVIATGVGAGSTAVVLDASVATAASFEPTTPVPLVATDMDDLGRITGGGSVYDPATNTVTNLPTLGYSVSADAITNGGLVAGSSRESSSSSEDHAIVYDLSTGVLTDLGTVGFNAWATDVTDAGLVVGWGYGEPGVTHGFISDLNTGAKTILEGDTQALAVNDDGLVLVQDPVGQFLLDAATGARTPLSDLIPGEVSVRATSLSDTGLVAGAMGDCEPNNTTCLVGRWDVFVHDLASAATWRLADRELLGEYPNVMGLTDGGAVVGIALSLDWADGFVAVPETGEIHAIPPPPEKSAAPATAMNNRGEIAGIGCFWDDFIPSQRCDAAFRTSVQLSPSPPLDISTASCAASAAIAWSPPRFDGFTPLTAYELRRNGTTIATLPPTVTSFPDPAATPGAAYQVVAHNAEGSSPPSALATWPRPPCVSGVLRGMVTASGTPQPGIAVRLYAASDGHFVRKTVTGPVGNYWFSSIPPGDYQLRFSDPTGQLVLEWFDDQPVSATADVLHITARAETIADADLTVAARMSGMVTGGGSGLGGINVRVYGATTGALVAKTTTGSDGSYAIEALTGQDVKIRFSDPTGFHQLQWYGGGTTFADAPQFTLVPGETVVADQDMPGAGVLTGTVADAGGAPVVGVPVLAYEPTTRRVIDYAFTGSDGGYRIAALRPGAVLVRFGDGITFPVEWYHDKTSVATADPVVIVAGATSTADEEYGPAP